MLKCQSPAGVLTRGVFLCLLLAADAHAGFFLTRNQNPFTVFQGQPLPLPAQFDSGEWQWQQSLDITNTLNLQSGGGQSLYADFESYSLNTRFRHAWPHGWMLNVDIPLIRRGGGLFDRAIDKWHQIFGLPRANRPNVRNDQFALRYVRDGELALDLQRDGGGLGDVSISVGRALLDVADYQLGLWLGVELPTGESAQLRGNGFTDFSLTLAARITPASQWQLDMNLGVVSPGGDLLMQNRAASKVLYGYFASGWQVSRWLLLRLQLEMHQAYFESPALPLMDSATLIVFGGTISMGPCHRLHIGFSEDIDVGASPDVSLLLSWQAGAC